jgi:hypothetical protein
MANKNTKRVRAWLAAKYVGQKRGAVNSTNNGRFNPKLDKEDHEQIATIRRLSRDLYGRTA